VTEEVDMNVVGAEISRGGGRGFIAAFAALAVGVAVALALASYAVTTADSVSGGAAKSSGRAAVAPVVLGPSASLPGASVAELNRYGRALTAHHPPVTLGPSASLPGASIAQLNRYGRALTAHR
jgi:hypothetical protein